MAVKNMDNITISLLVLGIGGSIAKSIRAKYSNITMIGYQHERA